MEKKLLPYLVLLSALSVSLSAAFYSVFGIGKLFSGASVQVMIMMTSLEIAKLVLASILYQYWDRFNMLLKTYYFIAVFVLMGITSAGIYGYLSSAYSETSNRMENVSSQVSVLNLKRSLYETQLKDIRDEKESIGQNISDLTKALSNNYIETRGRDGQITRTTSSGNRKSFENQLQTSQKRRDDISLKEMTLSDSISSIDIQKLNLETNADLASEIGPLKYIAKLTNKTMDQVINWFIIALMLVFDPLAVSLVVGANVIFKDRSKEREKKKISDEIDEKIENFKNRQEEMDKLNKEFDEKMQVIEEKESDISTREMEMESKMNQKEIELKSLLDAKEKEMTIKEEDLKFREEEYKKVESEIKNLNEIRNSIKLEKNSIEEEKKLLKEREISIDKSRDELSKLDQEIKRWESTHWKMRRNQPPPGA